MSKEHLIRRYEHNCFSGWVVAAKRRGRRWTGYFSNNPDGARRSVSEPHRRLRLARLVAGLGIGDWKGAVQLGLLLWIGFPFVLWTGAIMWENVPVKLAAIPFPSRG